MSPEQERELLELAATGTAKMADLQAKFGQWIYGILHRNGFEWGSDIVKPYAKSKSTDTPARGTKVRNDRRMAGFVPDNSGEKFYHCKAPFLRYVVSNHRRVAWAVDAGHGVRAGQVLTPRQQLVWTRTNTGAMRPVAVTCVRLIDDTGKRVERNVEFLFQNAAGQKPKKKKVETRDTF